MKEAALCITRDVLPETTINLGVVVPFDLSKVTADKFHFINREVCDAKDDQVFQDIGFTLPQVLPYAVIQCGNEILTYSRSKSGGESRLHGNRSIGFGGHIDMCDYYEESEVNRSGETLFQGAMCNGLNRELDEELGLTDLPDITVDQMSSVIIDPTNTVGMVHVGFPVYITLDSKDGIKPEHAISDLKWIPKDQLFNDLELYENWSKILINNF